MRSQFLNRVDGSRFAAGIARGVIDCYELGVIQKDRIFLNWADKAVVTISAQEDLLGFITYREDKDEKTAHTILGWTRPQSRGTGVYRFMFSELKEHLKASGINSIQGSVRMDNADMHAVMKKLDREAASIHYNIML